MKTQLFIFLIMGSLLSGCAFHGGVMTGNASLNNGEFRIVKQASGYAGTTHVLGIGGLQKQGLVFNAKQDLLKRTPLEKGQALANVVVDMRRSFYLFVMKTEVFLYADVVDFNPVQEAADNNSKTSVTPSDKQTDNFKLNDWVNIYINSVKYSGQIVEFRNDGVMVEYVNDEGKPKRIFQTLNMLEKAR